MRSGSGSGAQENVLIPQYSLRWLLGLVVVCAGVFSIFGLAARGHNWAIALSVAVLCLAAAALIYAVLFLLVWAYAQASGAAGVKGWGSSPFSPVVAQIRDEDQQSHPQHDEQPTDAILLD